MPALRLALLTSASVVLAVLGPAPAEAEWAGPPVQEPAAYDWIVEGGLVVDGTGAPARRADLLVHEGRIAHVGLLDPDTLEVRDRFDARGLTITPGFIDLHAHGDPVDSPGFGNFLAMGVTTILLGQDGSSPDAANLPAHLEAVSRVGPAVNVGYLVGHNTIRLESGVGHGEPDEAGLERMKHLVEEAMDAGAFGLSLGLEYTPGARANLGELVALAHSVAGRGGVIASHLRSEDADRVEASVVELLEQGRRSGAHVHASHLKIVLGSDPSQARRILEMMDDARSEGVRVTGDVYPYTASFTGLSILFPDWARPPYDYGQVVGARRAELAAHLRARVEARNGPEATLFATGAWAGRTLAEVAEELGRPFEEVLVDLGPGGARAAYFVMDEEVMTIFLEDPYVAVASDGGPGLGHPRSFGTFPRVIRRYVVEEDRLPLEEAVRKMTALPASVVGLDEPGGDEPPRGVLKEGWAADLAFFRPEELRDRADFERPRLPAEGMRSVWIAGEPVWESGRALETGRRGRVLRSRSPGGSR